MKTTAQKTDLRDRFAQFLQQSDVSSSDRRRERLREEHESKREAEKLAAVKNALTQLFLIAAAVDAKTPLQYIETADKVRVAIRDAAGSATRELELAFRLLWVPPLGNHRVQPRARRASGGAR